MKDDVTVQPGLYTCACGKHAVLLRPEKPRSKVFMPLCEKCAG
jgi:hypothetical protein